jgi:hypothetical protein
VSTYDDETPLEFFEEPETLESPQRQRRRMRPQRRPGGPRRPTPPPPGAVALARLAGFVALAIAVVLGLVFWVGSCQGKSTYDQYKSYMDKVQPIAQSSASAGGTAALAKVVNSTKLTLTGLQAKLEEWSRQQQQDYDDALRLVPPAPLQSAHQQILATLQLRAIGLTDLADKLAESGTKSPSKVAEILVNQAKLLSASDLVWAELFKQPATQTMKRAGVVGVIAPPSKLVTNPVVISFRAFKVVYRRLHATSGSTTSTPAQGLHGSEIVSTSAVAGGTTKALAASSPTTVNVAASLVFDVVFKNGGNFDETNIPVTLTITVFKNTVYTKKQVVRFIGKQAEQTVTFGNLQLPTRAFGAQATVNVDIGKVRGEATLSNNHDSYPVFFSLSH